MISAAVTAIGQFASKPAVRNFGLVALGAVGATVAPKAAKKIKKFFAEKPESKRSRSRR